MNPGPPKWHQVVAMAAGAERGIGSRRGAWHGREMPPSNRDISTRQPRRHFQASLADQKFTMIIDGNPCGFRAIISIEAGFDESIEVPNGLGIDREGDLLGFQGVDFARHSCDRSAIRMAKECHKNGRMASERFKLIENFSAAGWKRPIRVSVSGLLENRNPSPGSFGRSAYRHRRFSSSQPKTHGRRKLQPALRRRHSTWTPRPALTGVFDLLTASLVKAACKSS